MPAANIIDGGAPLAGAPAAPLWTEQCDNSTNFQNDIQPPDLIIPLRGAAGSGTVEVPTWIRSLGQIEKVTVNGTMRGKRGDSITVNLKHEAFGALPLLVQHGIQGPLTTAYPLPGETRNFLFGETIPPGYVFKNFVGDSTSTQITLPEGQSPTDYYFFYTGTAGYDWQVKNITPGAAPTTATIPAHRYPYSPTYNYDNVPTNGFLNLSAPIVFRGVRYRLTSPAGGDPTITTMTFAHDAFDSGAITGPTTNYFSTGDDAWNDFLKTTYYNNYPYNSTDAPYQSYSEALYTDYDAHTWQVINAVQTFTTYTIGVGTEYRLDIVFTVVFVKFPDLVWSVEPLAQVTWESVVPPSAVFQFYPPDYADYLLLAERSEPLELVMEDWKGKPADGVWTLEYIGNSAPIVASSTGSIYSSTSYSPSVQPAIVRIDNLFLRIQFKGNPQLQNTVINPTTAGGTTTATTQATLRPNGDDRAFIGILCGLNNSTTMGILCGYAVLRMGRSGQIYDVCYSIATTCNINHVNLPRLLQKIEYLAQDWADKPFSTKGDAGEAWMMGTLLHRIYPVRGQIGLRVKVTGSQLLFNLMGQYPVLPFIDPTVALITNYQRISINA